MEVKTKARLAMGAFLAACLIPSAGMLFVPERTAAANQQLAPPPSLTREDGSFNPEVFQEVTDYLADHFAFRQELITADAALNAAVFRVSAEEDVTLGRDGWLFYTETVDDYLRTAPLSQRQLWASAHTLALVQEYVQDRGARLLFTVAPNKATVYPEQLPSVGTPLAAQGNLDRLLPLLEAEGVPYAELRDSFFGHVYTMLAVVLGFTLFRADSLGAAWVMLSKMFTGFAPSPAQTLTLISLLDARTVCVLVLSVLLAFGLPQRAAERVSKEVGPVLSQGGQALGCAALFALCVLNLSKATFNPFIYFQF